MKVIKEFKTPKTIIITGQWIKNVEPALMIDDDETDITVRNTKGEWCNIFSWGQIYVITESEFNEFRESEHYTNFCDDDEDENMYMVLKDYVGTIGATAIIEGGQSSDDWEVDEYFQHQDIEGGLIINVTGNYKIEQSTIKDVIEFLKSDETSKIEEVTSPSLEEKLTKLEGIVEKQTKEIDALSEKIRKLSWIKR